MPDIFICYARKDTKAVTPWVRRLEAAGFDVWMDVTNVDGATVWASEIVEAISSCKVLMLMLTRHSAGSHHVVKELSLASDKERRVLPLMLEKTDVPASMQYHLAAIHYLELFGKEPDEAFESIVRALDHQGVTPSGEASEAAEPAKSPLGKRIGAAAKAFWAKARPAMAAVATKAGPLARRATDTTWKKVTCGIVGLALLALIIFSLPGGGATSSIPPTATRAPGISADNLPMAVQCINVLVETQALGLVPDEDEVKGTAGVLHSGDGKLVLITNSASLGLGEIGLGDLDKYKAWVTFTTGQTRRVTRFADNIGKSGLALLEVNVEEGDERLVAGEDFVVLPYRPKLPVEINDDILFVTLSQELDSTSPNENRARVRRLGQWGKIPYVCDAFFADTAVTVANRGGIVFKKDGGSFYWVGINLYGPRGIGEENLSIHAKGVLTLEGQWFNCTLYGVKAALDQLYDVSVDIGD
ncbi:MAG: toll/interleukin-1 receptor domain-containing protein [Planctomycetota bacterium]|jgi:hypothetical protein